MLLVDDLDSFCQYLGGMIGKPEDQIRLMLCMYAGYPLGYLFYAVVRGTMTRHIFSIITGFLLQLFMYRTQIIHPIIMTVVTYLLMTLLPRNQQHKAVFVFVLGYLSGSHIYRMITNFGGWDMDITTYTMILTCKLSAMAFCYRDGGYQDEQLIKESIKADNKIVQLPSVVEVLSYVYFSPACICGPFFEFADFKHYIEMNGSYSNIPNPLFPSLKRFLQGQVCLVINLVVGNHYWPLFCGTEEFAAFGFLHKVFYYYVAMSNQRFLYYTGWCVTDGAVIASGLGYRGKDAKTGEHRFDKIISIRIMEIETGLSPQIMMQHWNHMIHLWLKHYVYVRTLVPGEKPGLYNNLATFITSAFWHGFYPFYYVMFFFCALLGELSKDVYRSRIYFRFIPYPINSILANLFSLLAMNYMGISFMLLTFEKGLRFSGAMHHFVYIGIVLTLLVFRLGNIPRKAQKLEERLKAKAEAATTQDKKTN